MGKIVSNNATYRLKETILGFSLATIRPTVQRFARIARLLVRIQAGPSGRKYLFHHAVAFMVVAWAVMRAVRHLSFHRPSQVYGEMDRLMVVPVVTQQHPHTIRMFVRRP